MIEVFVAFPRKFDVDELGKTLEAWDLEGMEPVALQITGKRFGLEWRVTAENLARGDYILAAMNTAPVEEDFGRAAGILLESNPDLGLIWPEGAAFDVSICRRGIITHWPIPVTDTYVKEHAEAYQFAGYRSWTCPTLHYRPIISSLPS